MRTDRACALFALAGVGCVSSHVVDGASRAVRVEREESTWRAATRDDLVGYFESVRIDGEAAAALLRVYYSFERAGTYSGAALIALESGPQFQTLGGTWSLEGGVLDLEGGALAHAQVAGEELRLRSDAGEVVLRRAEIQ
ncbi:MAG: hypothetical protein ACKVWV_05980 [Planctomycetota bacterium]